jgi:hypothetical protein
MVDPEQVIAKEAALDRLRQAHPMELATPGVQDALVGDARLAGAGWGEIEEAVNSQPRRNSVP